MTQTQINRSCDRIVYVLLYLLHLLPTWTENWPIQLTEFVLGRERVSVLSCESLETQL